MTVAKYVKRPVVIEAAQLTDEASMGELVLWITRELDPADAGMLRWGMEGDVPHIVLEGEMLAALGDWVIRGVKGEFYPCKPDVFEQSYDAVLPGDEFDVSAVSPAVALRSQLPDDYELGALDQDDELEAALEKAAQDAGL